MNAGIEVTVTGHWVNYWFIWAFARPEVVVDGDAHAARWGHAVRIPAQPGKHRVAVGMKYRGTPWLLGSRPLDVNVADGQTVRLRARNGPLNQDPFTIRPDDSAES